jgi:hypothetical protein
MGTKNPLLCKHIPNAGNNSRVAISITIEEMVIARQQLGKQFSVSACENNRESIAKQRRGKEASSTILCFPLGRCKVVIKEANSESK